MSITITETRGITNDSTSTERRFFINGTLSVVDARAALITQLTTAGELIYAGHPYKDVSLSEDIRGAWRARVFYVTDQTTGGGGDSNDAISFDTVGGTRKVTLGKLGTEKRSTRPDGHGGTIEAPPCHDQIALNGDGTAEGVQAVARVFNFSRRKTLQPDQVTDAYIGAIFLAGGTINDDAWDAFAVGEVVFLGARGQKSDYGPWDMEFFFSAAPTPVTDGVVGRVKVDGFEGELTLEDVKPWDAQWTWMYPRPIDYNGVHLIMPVPEALYANPVYESTNFDLLNAV